MDFYIFSKNTNNTKVRNATFCNMQDGFYYSNLILSSMDTIIIELYIDYVEFTNPLGSHTGVDKLGIMHFKVKDLPMHLQSSLDSSFITNIHFVVDVEKYSYQVIPDSLVYDLRKLLDEGKEFQRNTYKVAIWQVVGDNFGLNKLVGFVANFSANFCCRFCLAKTDVLHKMLKEEISLLCNKAEKDMPCTLNTWVLWSSGTNRIFFVGDKYPQKSF